AFTAWLQDRLSGEREAAERAPVQLLPDDGVLRRLATACAYGRRQYRGSIRRCGDHTAFPWADGGARKRCDDDRGRRPELPRHARPDSCGQDSEEGASSGDAQRGDDEVAVDVRSPACAVPPRVPASRRT